MLKRRKTNHKNRVRYFQAPSFQTSRCNFVTCLSHCRAYKRTSFKRVRLILSILRQVLEYNNNNNTVSGSVFGMWRWTLLLHEMDQPGPPSEPQPTPAVASIDNGVWRWMRRLSTHIYGPKLEMSNVHKRPSRIWDTLTYRLMLTTGKSLSRGRCIRCTDTKRCRES